MKKKIIYGIIAIIIITVVAFFISFIMNLKKENDKLDDIMNKITNSYQILEKNITTYNNNRKTLSKFLDNYYTDKLENDYNNYINLLSEQEDTIIAINTNIEEIDTNCKDRLFSKKEVNNICSTYKKYYETVVNIFINDQAQVNQMIKKYNENASSPLEEYKSKKITEYIDYNNDGKYLEREEQ